MVYLLYTIFFISCIVLISSVLLQPGKTDAGALFTSNISSTAFQPRGAQSILSKISIFAAITFMLSALMLSMPALTGNISVLQTAGDAPTETAPVVQDNANIDVSTSANANSAAPANANPNDQIIVTNSNVTSVEQLNSNVAAPANTAPAANTATGNNP